MKSVHQVQTLASAMASLSKEQTTSRELVEKSLAAATDPSGEGARTFIRIDPASARQAADAIDRQRDQSSPSNRPLLGLPISVKDLFDVAGEPTPAGSIVLADAPPAPMDATVVARVRAAGAVLIGRTNMTEFAFSGLGINPHYGTPRNPFDRANGRIPGGSSSGAAISVADGMAAAAIGTDTGGSLRIPAALCGLAAFKPTARRVPLEGVLPLSPTLDSVGAIAPTVACCARVDAVLAGDPPTPLDPYDLAGLRVGVLQGYVLDGLESAVARRLDAVVSILSEAGAKVKETHCPALAEIPQCYANSGLAAFEAYQWHRRLIEQHRDLYDPRVLVRILRGQAISYADFLALIETRRRIISEAELAFADSDLWLLPTVPRVAPLIAPLVSSDAAYVDANTAMLRNPSMINFLDGCALTIPCHLPGEAPVGLMLAAPSGRDRQLLRMGLAIETVLAHAGCAIPQS
jgi:aspartyl-tRNA(Asn)/glutamyl-tRNA(Gln) amidotransferase subunit A